MRVAPSKYTVRVYSDEAGHIECTWTAGPCGIVCATESAFFARPDFCDAAVYGHLDVLNARCTEAVVPGLAPGCSYRFALVAGSAVGESDESAHSEALAVPAGVCAGAQWSADGPQPPPPALVAQTTAVRAAQQ